jgi:hypothetical protein
MVERAGVAAGGETIDHGVTPSDQGCRKRRNRVPDWGEIRCRFPLKSPAAFDRDRLPVCPDFCTNTLEQLVNRWPAARIDELWAYPPLQSLSNYRTTTAAGPGDAYGF